MRTKDELGLMESLAYMQLRCATLQLELADAHFKTPNKKPEQLALDAYGLKRSAHEIMNFVKSDRGHE